MAAFRYLAGHRSDSGAFGAFNVGTGKGTSVLEMIEMAAAASGRKIPYNVVSRRPGDIAEAVADVSLIEREMGWKAERSVAEGVASSWRFVSGRGA